MRTECISCVPCNSKRASGIMVDVPTEPRIHPEPLTCYVKTAANVYAGLAISIKPREASGANGFKPSLLQTGCTYPSVGFEFGSADCPQFSEAPGEWVALSEGLRDGWIRPDPPKDPRLRASDWLLRICTDCRMSRRTSRRRST